MTSERLSEIKLLLPRGIEGMDAFFVALTGILGQARGARSHGERLILAATSPPEGLPIICIQLADVTYPCLFFGCPEHFDLHADRFRLLCGTDPAALHEHSTPGSEGGEGKLISAEPQGSLEYDPAPEGAKALGIDEVARRLLGHVRSIDHVGVNLPERVVSRADWERFLGVLARRTNIYRYPTGEEWPFIVPATDEEYKSDISSFVEGREPRFELVFDRYADLPVVQISINTGLTRQETEQLFPDPYGCALPGLEEIFRSVYVDHRWPGMWLRLDLNFWSDVGSSEWATGRWLVTQGGRIRPGAPPTYASEQRPANPREPRLQVQSVHKAPRVAKL